MIRTRGWAVLFGFVAMVAPEASADPISIDFDSLAANTVVTGQFAADGVSFALLGSPPVAGPVVVATDLTNYPLASAPNMIVPGDDSGDPLFDIEITFDKQIDFFRMDVFDADEPLTVRGFLGAAEVASLFFPPGSNFQHYDILLGTVGGPDRFDRVLLDVVEGVAGTALGGPEFFDNLQFNRVPEPASSMLLAFGLVALALRRAGKPRWGRTPRLHAPR